ncbi:fam-l protein [Plasmodium malariae]|uniref:Fam-l protein n=1 Tax=Plasmodium malariae TaxID=5858 RepID=A0A1D3PAH3_PLAMA|nr:fam-l protein [Plasmodium malariae]SCN11981.1 fam-l protein [Plasmodium malariae]
MKILPFINIFTYIFFSSIYNFYIDKSTFYKCGNVKIVVDGKLCTRINRYLAKCKQNKDLHVVGLKEEIPNNRIYEKKKDISNNEKEPTGRKEQPAGCSLKNSKVNRSFVKSKSCMFETKKYSHLEKKIFKELDFVDFLRRNKNISDKTYKKTMRKKFSLRLGSPLLLFLLLSTLLIVDTSLCYQSGGHGFLELSGLKTILSSWEETLKEYFSWLLTGTSQSVLEPLFRIVLFVIPLLILGFTLTSYVFYYHKKAKKYEKIKFSKK